MVTEFRASLRVYIDTIRKGDMYIDKINNLMNCLVALTTNKDYAKLRSQIATENLDVLVGRIYNYTVKLASDNHVELTKDELNASSRDNSKTIVSLQTYLKAQKGIFEKQYNR